MRALTPKRWAALCWWPSGSWPRSQDGSPPTRGRDAGEYDQAEHIYRLGISAAHQAQDHTLAGQLMGCLGCQKTNTSDTHGGLDLARAALEEAGEQAPARARALHLDRVAWAHTKHGEDEPDFLYWVDRGELEVLEARVHTERHRPLRAVPKLTDVLGRYDASHVREVALYLSWLAVALADANEPEEAAATAERMFSMAADVPSQRTADRGQIVLARLRQFSDTPEVWDLLRSTNGNAFSLSKRSTAGP